MEMLNLSGCRSLETFIMWGEAMKTIGKGLKETVVRGGSGGSGPGGAERAGSARAAIDLRLPRRTGFGPGRLGSSGGPVAVAGAQGA